MMPARTARTALTAMQYRLFRLLEKAEPGDRASWWTDIGLSIVIGVNLIAVCLETVPVLYHAYQPVFWWIETISVSMFALEYGLRIWVAAVRAEWHEGMSRYGARARYILSPTGLIDLIAILPSLLPLLMGGIDLRWLRVLRLARLFKLSHYNSALEDLIAAIKHERRSFFATVYLLLLAMMVSSTLIYVAEQAHQPAYFGSIPQSMWWSFVTLTTVGYGDVVPVTVLGKIIAGATALMGVCVVALLTGIVATGFANQMAMKRRRMETEIRNALSDGVLSEKEKQNIDALSKELNLSEQDVRVLLERLKSDKKF